MISPPKSGTVAHSRKGNRGKPPALTAIFLSRFVVNPCDELRLSFCPAVERRVRHGNLFAPVRHHHFQPEFPARSRGEPGGAARPGDSRNGGGIGGGPALCGD